MKNPTHLAYTNNQKPVAIGDVVTVDGERYTVHKLLKPSESDSEGYVYVNASSSGSRVSMTKFSVSVIGAKWIEH